MKKEILIVAKTYPNLSKKYEETVCIAGVTKEGEWVRLFPVRFRQLPPKQKFHKFDIIEADIEKFNDVYMRRESHRVKNTSIRVIGSIPAPAEWEKRKKILLSKLENSVEKMEEDRIADKKTIGIIKPKEIMSFYKKDIDICRGWEKELVSGQQKTLEFFSTGSGYKTPLEKIPYWMGYNFKCENPDCNGHNMMCEDWEMLQLFRSMKQKYGDDEIAFGKVKERFLDWMLKGRDLYFVLGTESRHNQFLIIAVFYPPKV